MLKKKKKLLKGKKKTICHSIKRSSTEFVNFSYRYFAGRKSVLVKALTSQTT